MPWDGGAIPCFSTSQFFIQKGPVGQHKWSSSSSVLNVASAPG